MSAVRKFALALLGAAAFGATPAHAIGTTWENEYNDEQKPWKEIEAQIPAYPKDANLIRFDAGPATPHRFYIDALSLSVGDDGVVRYTLVVKTAGGATNVTYEGMRCEKREQKYYALGHANGGWTRARNSSWRRIEYQDVNRHHGVLFSDFLCGGGIAGSTPAASVKAIVQRLKYGQPQKVVE